MSGWNSRATIGWIRFLGTAFSEPQLIEMGFAFEHATSVRRAPSFLPTLP